MNFAFNFPGRGLASRFGAHCQEPVIVSSRHALDAMLDGRYCCLFKSKPAGCVLSYLRKSVKWYSNSPPLLFNSVPEREALALFGNARYNFERIELFPLLDPLGSSNSSRNLLRTGAMGYRRAGVRQKRFLIDFSSSSRCLKLAVSEAFIDNTSAVGTCDASGLDLALSDEDVLLRAVRYELKSELSLVVVRYGQAYP